MSDETLGPLIGAGIAGIAGLGAAKIQSNAASKGQQAQQSATDKALAVMKEQTAPYRGLGQQGVDRLTALGPAQPYTQQFTGRPNGSNGYQAFQPQGQATQGGGPGNAPEQAQYIVGPGPGRTQPSVGWGTGPLGAPGPGQPGYVPPQAQPQGGSLAGIGMGGGPQAMGQGDDPLVTMIGPDGSQRQIPRSKVPLALQRGARQA